LTLGVPQVVIDKFIRIFPIAWDHTSFTGRYNFKKDNTTVNLETIINILEAKFRKIA